MRYTILAKSIAAALVDWHQYTLMAQRLAANTETPK